MAESAETLLTFKKRGRIVVGTIERSSVLSALNVSKFSTQVQDFVRENPGLNLLLNFEHVGYLSSVVLTELLRINKRVQETKGKLRLCAVSKTIREVFEITNLDSVFVVHEEGVEMDLPRFERSLDIAASEAAWKAPDEA